MLQGSWVKLRETFMDPVGNSNISFLEERTKSAFQPNNTEIKEDNQPLYIVECKPV